MYLYIYTHSYIKVTPHGKHCLSLTKFNPFMLYVVKQSVYSNIHVQHYDRSLRPTSHVPIITSIKEQ